MINKNGMKIIRSKMKALKGAHIMQVFRSMKIFDDDRMEAGN